MIKTMCKETKIKKAISLINSGKTWEEVSDLLGNSVAYLQKIVRESYKTPTRYNNLLKKARENKKTAEMQSVTEEIEPVNVDVVNEVEEEEEVILVETGYLLENGISVITGNVLPIYIPSFCLRELDKMARDDIKAEEILLVINSIHISTTNLKGIEREYIKVLPTTPVKDRIKGITAAAVYLSTQYPHVRVLTNSYEVEKMIRMQNCEGINIIVEKMHTSLRTVEAS